MVVVFCYWASKLWRTTLIRHHGILYLVTFLVVLPFACKDLRYSLFFSKWQSSDQAKELIRVENDARLRTAEGYFANVPFTDIEKNLLEPLRDTKSAKLSVGISVITVSRNRHVVDDYKPKYLTQVLWRLLDLANSSQNIIQHSNYAFHISICNVDFDPVNYEEVKKFYNFTVYQRFTQMSFALDHPLEKEKQDYVYCMNASSHHDFVFLLEDDAYPHEHFFPVLIHTLNQFTSSLDHLHNDAPAYIKFYHPERLSLFHFGDIVSVFELIAWTMLFGSVLHIIYCCFQHLPLNSYSSWAFCGLYSLVVALCVDRPGLMEMRRWCAPLFYTLLPAPSCCTPAMLFPSSSARAIAAHMQTIACRPGFGKDSILDDFLCSFHMQAYLVQPNTVLHIGMYSALRRNIVDPFLM
jgi:hypothetical protein